MAVETAEPAEWAEWAESAEPVETLDVRRAARVLPYDDGYEAWPPYETYDTYTPEPGPGPEPAPAPVPARHSSRRRRRPTPPPPHLPQNDHTQAAPEHPPAENHLPTGTHHPARNLRRLVPQALVVAFLAGGTSAFVANDKAVELSVDGAPRTMHTFADNVAELLADEGVTVGAHDIIAPAPGAELASGDEVVVRHGRPLLLTLDGHRRQVWTTARTVDAALRQLGVRAEGAFLSVSRSSPIARHGLALDVRTERAVTFMADGRERTIRTNAATVGEALAQAGITLRGQDTTSVGGGRGAPGPPAGAGGGGPPPAGGGGGGPGPPPPPPGGAPPPPPGAGPPPPPHGQTVTVLRVTGREEVREEAIPYDTVTTRDASLFRGTEVVDRQGRQGVRRVTYALRTVNGVRQKPRRLHDEIVREPVTQRVRVGTKVMPTSVAGADGLNWSALAACESGGRPGAVDASGNYGGLYQFDTGTWQALGGTGRPQDAPASEQTFRAKKLYVQRGASPWPHCGRRLTG
ncbi:ubiquitin-like domain-containing protein [Streptomyces sp. NPDC088261]|uniref:ubiquitin-like domain-containing protein n=1 Tax=Streptomyces sp. NPDC088261 TaxID=3365851 RepID=UPI0037F2978D